MAQQANVERALKAHKQLLELPVYTSGRFIGSGSDRVVVETSHTSVSQLKKRKASQYATLTKSREAIFSPLSFTSEEVQHTSYSPGGSFYALFRSVSPRKDDKSQEKKKLIEFWSSEGTKLADLDVDHGDWRFDDTFGQPQWQADSLAIVYTAQVKDKADGPEKFRYLPDWGERFDGVKRTDLFLVTLGRLDAMSPSVHRLTSEDRFPNVAFGQPVLGPAPADGVLLFATVYSPLADDRRLGLVYCQNRPAAVHQLKCEMAKNGTDTSTWQTTELKRISPEDRSARSPRLRSNADGPSQLVFVSNRLGGPHASCASLHLYDCASGQSRLLVHEVNQPKNVTVDFPGLYIDQLPTQPFCEGKEPSIVATSIWRSRRVPVRISLKTGHVESLAPWPAANEDDAVLPYLQATPTQLMSFNVLSTNGRSLILATRSSPALSAELVLFDSDAPDAGWKVLKQSASKSLLKSTNPLRINWTVLPLPKFGQSEIILLSGERIDPAAESKRNLAPTITIPHGGPHSTYVTDFSVEQAALVLAGYRLAVLNYPGSLGFGQSFVDELPPQLGELDVNATLAVGHYLNTLSLASRTKGKKLLMGGSHGGFISSHLTGQHPDEFDACVMRNPVVDLPSMSYMTDIPDWIWEETTLSYDFKRPPSILRADTFQHLHDRSPLKHADKVKTPTLLCVGLGDRRVPPDQARTWYHTLKSFGQAPVEMLVYPDNGHALDGTVEAQSVGFEGILAFLAKHTDFEGIKN